MYETSIPDSFSGNGERIYFTGTSERGGAIVFSGGGMHMRMMGGSCATCHGADRQGGVRMMPYFWKIAPPLTAEILFDHHDESGQGHAGHGNYTDATLKRAISTGIDPAERLLDDLMPRWHMSEEDMADLIAFLND